MAALMLETVHSPPPGVEESLEKFQCLRCPRSFKRPEHLKRHQRSHDGNKRFVCLVCSKRFARSDILSRHETMHAANANPDLVSGHKRACTECAKSRQRCSKGEPCRRCSSRLLICQYPPEEVGDFREPQSPILQTRLLDMNEPNSEPLGSSAPMNTSFLSTASPRQFESTSLAHNENQEFQNRTMEACSNEAHVGQDLAFAQDTSSPDIAMANNTASNLGPTLQPSASLVPISQNMMQYYNTTPLPQGSGHINGLDDPVEFPINWLPMNEAIDIDYTTILGFGINELSSYTNSLPAVTQPFGPHSLQPDASMGLQQSYGGPEGFETASTGRSPSDQQLITSPNGIPSPARTASEISQSSLSRLASVSSPGDLYATSSNGARIPCTTRVRRPPTLIEGTAPISPVDSKMNLKVDNTSYAFPSLEHISPQILHDLFPGRRINDSTFTTIKTQFQQLCLSENSPYPAYSTNQFLKIDHLNMFVELYFKNFQPIFPIYHEYSSDINDCWPLALAVSAIGCQYTGTREFSLCVTPLQEFLRRTLNLESEKIHPTQWSISLMQAMVLNQVSLVYDGSIRLSRFASTSHGMLIQGLQSLRLLHELPNPNISNISRTGRSWDQRWKDWIAEETKRRIGYSIWLLDAMAVYHFCQRPFLTLDEALCDLPHDGLWAASTSAEWAVAFETCERNPSLVSAVQRIFLQKQVKSDLGEFSRTILLHGVYQELQKVQGYFNRPLALWMPSAQLAQNPNQDDDSTSQLERKHLLASWKNAALDCIDVLHWAANATIAQLSGAEHPTVLHLHISRVVLLVPYKEIQSLASSIATLVQTDGPMSHLVEKQEALSAEREVVQWAQRDEHKARLAALHCGCFYWHIRRYSFRAFYEPKSVLLVTLTLWAYSSYASRSAPQQRPGSLNQDGSRSGSVSRQPSPDNIQPPISGRTQEVSTLSELPAAEDEPEPTFIRLDRPNDDEMVQLFVRSGRPSAMRAHITGVGDICSPNAPVRILREGKKILRVVSTAWGRTSEYISLLESLERAMTENAVYNRRVSS